MKKLSKKIKLIIFLVIVMGIVYFIVVSPMLQFSNGEKRLEKAAKRYFEVFHNELPTGERVKTVTLKELYHKSFIDKDIKIPYTNTTCSTENSWVKVKRVDNDYKYYVYLECGLLKSNIDHTGPTIKLNGDDEITINVGEEYKELGVKSVKDSVDGKLDIKDVVIKGNVDVNKLGTYQITYTAFDKMSNKNTVTRKVTVVHELYHTIKKDLGDKTNYQGNPQNNFIKLSNMLFRIYGYDNDKNIILVSDEDIANVNYTKVDKWLEYYYSKLNDFTKKNIVEKKYCNMSSLENPYFELVDCSSYSSKKKITIPSVVDINKAEDVDEEEGTIDVCFMETPTISWTATSQNDENAYAVRDVNWGEYDGLIYVPYSKTDNYGVRPMFAIKGDLLISSGDGTVENPYDLGDTPKASNSSLIHDRFIGEYVVIKGTIYRIVDLLSDGTTKVVSVTTIGNPRSPFTTTVNDGSEKMEYNPKDKNSVAHFINNKSADYIDTSLFVNHEIEVPIYKNKIIYGEEVEKKKYKVLLSAPEMYELFSAQPQRKYNGGSYWLLNSSKTKKITGYITDIGVVYNGEVPTYIDAGIRVVGYLKNNVIISSGKGTLEKPYKLSK